MRLSGTIVHLKGYGMVKVFKIVAPNGDIDYWATNDLNLGELQRLQWSEFAWAIEEYPKWAEAVLWGRTRSSTFFTGATQSYWIGNSGNIRLKLYWSATGISWYEAKLSIVRDAVRAYLAAPRFFLHPTA